MPQLRAAAPYGTAIHHNGVCYTRDAWSGELVVAPREYPAPYRFNNDAVTERAVHEAHHLAAWKAAADGVEFEVVPTVAEVRAQEALCRAYGYGEGRYCGD